MAWVDWLGRRSGQSVQIGDAGESTRLVVESPLRWRLEGPVTMQTAAGLQRAGLAALRQQQTGVRRAGATVEIDWSGVTQADSAGLALLLSWQRAAQVQALAIRCTHLPAHLVDIAELSGLQVPGQA